MQRSETDWKEFTIEAWWIMVAPCLAYFIIEQTWHVRTDGQQLLLGFLCLVGGVVYFVPRK
jgi:hypothetical protein